MTLSVMCGVARPRNIPYLQLVLLELRSWGGVQKIESENLYPFGRFRQLIYVRLESNFRPFKIFAVLRVHLFAIPLKSRKKHRAAVQHTILN